MLLPPDGCIWARSSLPAAVVNVAVVVILAPGLEVVAGLSVCLGGDIGVWELGKVERETRLLPLPHLHYLLLFWLPRGGYLGMAGGTDLPSLPI